jgi:SET and MYND domain-containing protein
MRQLQSNEDKFPSDRLAELEMVADTVLAVMPRSHRLDEDELVTLMCSEQCNSFGVWGRDREALGQLVGFGIFPRLCALNHDCLPNCTVVQEVRGAHRVLTVRALSAVAAGDELCISYSDGDLLRGPLPARAAWLAATYHFDCSCALCAAAAADPRAARQLARDFDRRHRCRRAGCGGLRYPDCAGAGGGVPGMVCGSCGATSGAGEECDGGGR